MFWTALTSSCFELLFECLAAGSVSGILEFGHKVWHLIKKDKKKKKYSLILWSYGSFACFMVLMFYCRWLNLFAVGGTFSSLLFCHRWGESLFFQVNLKHPIKGFKPPPLPLSPLAVGRGRETSVSAKSCNGLTMRRVGSALKMHSPVNFISNLKLIRGGVGT